MVFHVFIEEKKITPEEKHFLFWRHSRIKTTRSYFRILWRRRKKLEKRYFFFGVMIKQQSNQWWNVCKYWIFFFDLIAEELLFVMQLFDCGIFGNKFNCLYKWSSHHVFRILRKYFKYFLIFFYRKTSLYYLLCIWVVSLT